MRTIEMALFQYDELSEDAQEKAREWFERCTQGGFAWAAESIDSIEKFCDEFGVSLMGWACNPYESPRYKTNAENYHFRGRKLREFKRDTMPTGYCLDCALYEKFFDEFKRTGDAKHAFDTALWAGFIEWRDDMESQLTREYIEDAIRANEYEFTADGARA